MRHKEIYALDLRVKHPKILIFDQDDISELMQRNNVNDVLELSNYDVRLFKHWHEANDFLNRYVKAEQDLCKFKIKKSAKNNMPKILYKKRYMIQTMIGEKNQTVRDSKRVKKMLENLKPKDCFQLYDQTHAITVMLTKTKKLDETRVQYDFRIV